MSIGATLSLFVSILTVASLLASPFLRRVADRKKRVLVTIQKDEAKELTQKRAKKKENQTVRSVAAPKALEEDPKEQKVSRPSSPQPLSLCHPHPHPIPPSRSLGSSQGRSKPLRRRHRPQDHSRCKGQEHC